MHLLQPKVFSHLSKFTFQMIVFEFLAMNSIK